MKNKTRMKLSTATTFLHSKTSQATSKQTNKQTYHLLLYVYAIHVHTQNSD